jgi:hypothetical protein
MRLNATRLRGDLYRILDRVLETGEPAEIERRGRLLRIAPVGEPSAVDRIAQRPERIVGDPDELVEIGWSVAWQPAEPRAPVDRRRAAKRPRR